MNIKKLFVTALAGLTLAACGQASQTSSNSNQAADAKKEAKTGI